MSDLEQQSRASVRRPVLMALTVIVLIMSGAGVFVFAARSGWLTPDEATMRAKYALPNSRFIDIDGESIHYVDEGSGAAIVLIHGSFSSLLSWNEWAKSLSDHYRVIRFDRPPMGLSGANPTGVYGAEREMQIVECLTASLGAKRFFLVATSSAGESGAAYAAAHPEQILGLILSNIAVGKVQMNSDGYSPWFRLVLKIDPWFNGWHLAALWREVLRVNFFDPDKVMPEMVAQWTDLNNRA